MILLLRGWVSCAEQKFTGVDTAGEEEEDFVAPANLGQLLLGARNCLEAEGKESFDHCGLWSILAGELLPWESIQGAFLLADGPHI